MLKVLCSLNLLNEVPLLKIVAIIPARAGSKGIPKKNLVDLAGRPLIAWSILAARESIFIDRVIVSTDSEEIAEVALSNGADVPFIRPRELATDNTPGIDVIVHALEWLSVSDHYKADYVMVLQPTSPLRSVDDIDTAIRIMKEKRAGSVVSVTLVKQHPYWMKQVDDRGGIKSFCEEGLKVSRQELPPVYIINGAVYLAPIETVLRKRSMYTERTVAYIMPSERSVDIDEPIDLVEAEYFMKNRSLS